MNTHATKGLSLTAPSSLVSTAENGGRSIAVAGRGKVRWFSWPLIVYLCRALKLKGYKGFDVVSFCLSRFDGLRSTDELRKLSFFLFFILFILCMYI